jgi:glycosyltransferase involved in cell wall biosynthesis
MKIVIFNLETDLDSQVLSAAHDWVEAFANNFDEVRVFSTHVGRVQLPPNVKVIEIGGGSVKSRTIALVRLCLAYAQIFKWRKQSVVFHHMSPRTALILGPFIKAIKVPQGLWYSHNHASLSLRFSKIFMSHLFSSTRDALPIKSSKSKFVGHGIKVERFASLDVHNERQPLSIISVGRIVPVKHLEDIANISNIQPNSRDKRIQITLLGPQPDPTYLEGLRSFYQKLDLDLVFIPPVSYELVVDSLRKNYFYFTGTPKSVDKAAIEAAIAGCFVVSTNMAALETTGMNEVWSSLGYNPPKEISEQVLILSQVGTFDTLRLRKRLQESAINRNNLQGTISRITKILIPDDAD